MTPLEAATHADPYAYYADLRSHEDLPFDAGLGLWIASRAQTVEAVLAHPDCRVRPAHEPVPAAIAQRAAGQVFARLMRMNEGAAHRCPRAIVEPALAAVNAQHVAGVVTQLGAGMHNPDDWMFTVPVSVVAQLLGVPREQLNTVAALTRDFVACLSPLSTATQLHDADRGASQLRQLLSGVLEATGMLAQIRKGDWADAEVLDANLIGLLSQTCEATAGLIGNTLVLLARRPDLVEQVMGAPRLATALVQEVARYDSPVQNTRRFVAARCTVGGRVMEAGATILVLLGSANRDPDANPNPDSFQLQRLQRRVFSFGSGRHRCPGQTLALTIAAQIILEVLQRQPAFVSQATSFSYWPSLNGRIPRFHGMHLGQ